jgi:16S rRNA (guanine966-N2)-methyltransferase
MKDRVREAVFNLVGPDVRGKHALDLFAGTGALGLEALSRGADRATFIEQHFPSAEMIRKNIARLGVADRTAVIAGDVFLWARRPPDIGTTPQLIFCSPPYEFYVSRWEAMLGLIGTMLSRAPGASILVVEADRRFDWSRLPEAGKFDVRRYPPAVVGVYRKAS